MSASAVTLAGFGLSNTVTSYSVNTKRKRPRQFCPCTRICCLRPVGFLVTSTLHPQASHRKRQLDFQSLTLGHHTVGCLREDKDHPSIHHPCEQNNQNLTYPLHPMSRSRLRRHPIWTQPRTSGPGNQIQSKICLVFSIGIREEKQTTFKMLVP